MALQSGAVKGALVLFMVACIVTSAMSMSSPVPGTVSEVAQAMEGYVPCFAALKGLEKCSVEILKAVFGLPLDSSCCQVVYLVAQFCVPTRFPLSEVILPVALQKCIPCTLSERVNCTNLKWWFLHDSLNDPESEGQHKFSCFKSYSIERIITQNLRVIFFPNDRDSDYGLRVIFWSFDEEFYNFQEYIFCGIPVNKS